VKNKSGAIRGSWDLGKSTSRLAAAAAATSAASAGQLKTPSPLNLAELRARSIVGLSPQGGGAGGVGGNGLGARFQRERVGGRSLKVSMEEAEAMEVDEKQVGKVVWVGVGLGVGLEVEVEVG